MLTHSSFSIDATALSRIKSLELRAKVIMEGLWKGMHRSPYHGFSVEFSEYRAYVQGDDPRYIDWKVLARSDRTFIKKFEDETNLRCHLPVDSSRSMNFGSRPYTKLDYARTLAATLAYFLGQQGDASRPQTARNRRPCLAGLRHHCAPWQAHQLQRIRTVHGLQGHQRHFGHHRIVGSHHLERAYRLAAQERRHQRIGPHHLGFELAAIATEQAYGADAQGFGCSHRSQQRALNCTGRVSGLDGQA